jgi:hypothetical protein
MRRNARIMIALAAYAQRWNFTESVIVKERMQQDALRLQRATLQVILRTVFRTSRNAGVLPGRAVFYLHDSVGAYHLMTKRLLTLYRTSHAGLYPSSRRGLGRWSSASGCLSRQSRSQIFPANVRFPRVAR